MLQVFTSMTEIMWNTGHTVNPKICAFWFNHFSTAITTLHYRWAWLPAVNRKCNAQSCVSLAPPKYSSVQDFPTYWAGMPVPPRKIKKGGQGTWTTPFWETSLKLTMKIHYTEKNLWNWPWKSGIFEKTTRFQNPGDAHAINKWTHFHKNKSSFKVSFFYV
jgi:hypothetical protein